MPRLRKTLAVVLCLPLALLAPPSLAEGLPDLGEHERLSLSFAAERRLGERIMLDIRREPTYLDDPAIQDYLNRLGQRLIAQAEGVRFAFEFFVVRDPLLNAFALPGGFVGVHTGLILAARTESELAGVLAHEIAHVAQSHLVRLLGTQNQAQLASLLAMAVAILAAKNNPEVATGTAIAGQAAGIQQQLNYSRDFEREADRFGLDLLARAGFDPRGMASFFERMLQFSRLYENNAPVYLRTHPLTTERIADIENRLADRPYRQVPDSVEFGLVRAKLRALEGTPTQAIAEFAAQLSSGKYAREEEARYGLAYALLRAGKSKEAAAEVARLRRLAVASPLIDLLEAETKRAQGDAAGAVRLLGEARQRHPEHRPLLYALLEAQLAARETLAAARLAREEAQLALADTRLWRLLARAEAAVGRRAAEHRALAEVFLHEGRMSEAIRQLELARAAGDGDFFEQSQIDARLAELRRRQREEEKERPPR